MLNFSESQAASFCVKTSLEVTDCHFVLVPSGTDQSTPALGQQSSSSLRRREGFEKQVGSQAGRYGSLGDALLQVQQGVSDTGVVLEVEQDVLLDQAPHPHLLLGPPPALQLAAG